MSAYSKSRLTRAGSIIIFGAMIAWQVHLLRKGVPVRLSTFRLPRTPVGTLVILLLAVTLQVAAAELTVNDFLAEPDVLDAELSPDGKHLALVVNERRKKIVVVRNVETPDMPVVSVLAEDAMEPEWLVWGNNDRLLISMSVPWAAVAKKLQRSVFLEGSDGPDFSRMVAVNKDMSGMAVLMQEERNLRNNFSLSRVTNFLPEDPDHVLMAAYQFSTRSLYKVNINTGKAEFLTKGSANTYRFFSDDEGKPLYRFDYRERKKTYEIFKFTGDDKWELIDTLPLNWDDEASIGTNQLVALRGESIVYRKLNEETGYFDLVLADRTTREQSVLASIDGQDVYGALFDNRSDQLVGYRVEKDNVRNVYFDAAQQEQYDAIATQIGNYNFHVSTLDPEHRRALVRAHGPDSPYMYLLWDFEKQALTFLAHENELFTAENLAAPAVTSYVARDGTRLRAYILLPRSFEKGKPHPTIIMPHGGPSVRSRQDYDHFAQFLSTRGYIVVMPNFRGSSGYGRDFETAGYRQWGGVMQDDVTDAAKFMVDKGYADPERMCIVGASYGGYVALMGAVKTPDLFKCAISVNGVTHLAEQIEYEMDERVDEIAWQAVLFDQVGHPVQDKAMLDANSPALHADKIKIPVLIVAGTDDSVVPFSQAKKMVKALKKAKVPHQFLSLANAGHYVFVDRENSLSAYNAIERFLAMYLY